jgi:hypothetical protein
MGFIETQLTVLSEMLARANRSANTEPQLQEASSPRLLPVVSDCLPVLQLKKNNLLQFQEIC